jgi:hypothetical protein
MSKLIAWFSCGAASAVAAKRALEQNKEVLPVYCDTMSTEHPDNQRFFDECQEWFGVKILRIKSTEYLSIDEVFEKERYMSGVHGARCTAEMKKVPRHTFCTSYDRHIFGYTADEKKRIRDFKERNHDLLLWLILVDLGITKEDCYQELRKAGIELPAMYRLGYRNNNCLGCVKSSSPGYWSKIRKDFPEVFKRRSEQSRAIGCRLVEIKHHERIFLDELPEREFKYRGENLSCGPECGVAP